MRFPSPTMRRAVPSLRSLTAPPARALRLASATLQLLADVAQHTAALLRPPPAGVGVAGPAAAEMAAAEADPAVAERVAAIAAVEALAEVAAAEALAEVAAAEALADGGREVDRAPAATDPPPTTPSAGTRPAPTTPRVTTPRSGGSPPGHDLERLAEGTARDAIAAVADLSGDELSALYDLEAARRGRRTVLRAIEATLAPGEPASSTLVHTSSTP